MVDSVKAILDIFKQLDEHQRSVWSFNFRVCSIHDEVKELKRSQHR